MTARKVVPWRSLRKVALHESAHAVVMLAAGREVDAIAVEEEELSHEFTAWTGYVHRGIANDYVPNEHEAAANLAGYAAEVVFGFSKSRSFPDLLAEWDMEVEENPDTPHDVGGARFFAEGAFRNARVYDFEEEDVDALLARVWRSTLDYLRRPEVRAAVEALARLVARRRVIEDPRTIARAVERAAGRLPRLARPRLVPPRARVVVAEGVAT